jgi:hypothetical protein
MGVGGAPRAVGGRVAGSPLREAVGISPAPGHYARSFASADSEFMFDPGCLIGLKHGSVSSSDAPWSNQFRQRGRIPAVTCGRRATKSSM